MPPMIPPVPAPGSTPTPPVEHRLKQIRWQITTNNYINKLSTLTHNKCEKPSNKWINIKDGDRWFTVQFYHGETILSYKLVHHTNVTKVLNVISFKRPALAFTFEANIHSNSQQLVQALYYCINNTDEIQFIKGDLYAY